MIHSILKKQITDLVGVVVGVMSVVYTVRFDSMSNNQGFESSDLNSATDCSLMPPSMRYCVAARV